MPAPVIYINGFPGVGKLTVARTLQPLLPGSRILHNHELIDPVEKKYPRGSAYYQIKRAEYRQARLKPIMTDPALRDTVFIFTDSQTDHNECVGDYTDLMLDGHGRRFYSVILYCDTEENERRLVMPGRGGTLNGKLSDVKVLREYKARDGILKFGDDDRIKIDVTSISAQGAAERNAAFVERRQKEPKASWDDDDYP